MYVVNQKGPGVMYVRIRTLVHILSEFLHSKFITLKAEGFNFHTSFHGIDMMEASS